MSRPVMTRNGGRNPVGTGKPAIIIGGVILAIAAIFGLSQLVPKSSKAPAVVTDPGTSPSLKESAAKEPVAKELAGNAGRAPVETASLPTTTGTTPPPAPVTPPPVSLTQGRTPLLADRSTPPSTLANQTTGTPGSSTPTTSSPGTAPGTAPAGLTPTGTTPSSPTAMPPPSTVGTPGGTPGTIPGNTPAMTDPTGTPGSSAPLPTLSPVAQLIEVGERALSSGKPLEARVQWSKALQNAGATGSEQATLRDKLTKLNEDLVFSPKVTPGDPLCETYSVVSGDALVKIAKKRELATDWRLIQRVNKMANANSLRVGQKLKLIRGPFHAIVHKSDYRLDLFFGSPDEPEQWQYVRSFQVGLGEGNGTPVGTFIIKKGSKLENPPWVNPRTGQKFDKDDPKNPIGEYWLGFQGVGSSAAMTGYGLHGTIEPQSIGKQMSMGCVRMGSDDIKQVFELLVDEVSVVRIVP